MLRLKIQPQSHRVNVSLEDGQEVLYEGVLQTRAERIKGLGIEMQRLLARGWQHDGGNEQDHSELANVAEELSKAVFSPELSSLLSSRRGDLLTIELSSDWLFVPWELATIDGQSLAQHFAIGRTVADLAVVRGDSTRSTSVIAPTRFRIWANPALDLLHAEDESHTVRKILTEQPGSIVELNRLRKSRQQLLQLLDGVDCFHFAGHSHVSDGQRSWLLSDGDLTARDVLDSSIDVPQFLFAHACGSANVHWESPHESLVTAFLRRGMGNYLGLWTPILDYHALQFAEAFYRELAGGATLGVAVLNARRQVRERFGWRDLLAGNYVLYGDPARKPIVAVETPNIARTNDTMKTSIHSDARQLQYPVHCSRCDRELKSHFLVSSFDESDRTGAVICRYCTARQVVTTEPPVVMPRRELAIQSPSIVTATVSRQAIDAEPEAKPMNTPSSNPTQPSAPAALTSTIATTPPSTTTPERKSPKTLPAGWDRLLKSVIQPQRIRDPETGLTHEAHWKMTRSELGRVSYRLEVNGKLAKAIAPNWELQILFVDKVEESTSDSAGRLTADIEQLGDSSQSTVQFIVLVSSSEWSPTAIDSIASLLKPENKNARQQFNLTLIDLNSTVPHQMGYEPFNRELLRFLSWESESDRMRRILGHITSLRPLETSLSALAVSEQLAVPVETVLLAFRNLAASEKLHLDDVQPFGWIISESFE